MKRYGFLALLLSLSLVVPLNSAMPATILLDADTPATGSNLDTTPLVTQYGTITYSGWLCCGYFYHDTTPPLGSGPLPYGEFVFDFDVDSISFVFGGGVGGIYVEALDINDSVVDSYQTLDFGDFQGPTVTVSGSGIRRFTFIDGRMVGLSEIDNVLITTSAAIIPEPASSILFIVGGAALCFRLFKKRIK